MVYLTLILSPSSKFCGRSVRDAEQIKLFHSEVKDTGNNALAIKKRKVDSHFVKIDFMLFLEVELKTN